MISLLKRFKRILKTAYLHLTQIYFGIAAAKVECNICHFKANTFDSDSWHLHCNCPRCSSGVRQRLLYASLTLLDDFQMEKLIRNKRVLHFAPEKILSDAFKSKAANYKTADFLTEGYAYEKIDYNIDISSMKEIKDNSFDCVIACDVLEHVPDHIAAMKEVNRVLSPGGYCILTVPQKDNLADTYEDLSITDPKEREKAFGQFDHLRIYGNDFTDLLTRCGFAVSAVNEKYFKPETVVRHVLFPPVLSKHPLATNYRKVFFGKKADTPK